MPEGRQSHEASRKSVEAGLLLDLLPLDEDELFMAPAEFLKARSQRRLHLGLGIDDRPTLREPANEDPKCHGDQHRHRDLARDVVNRLGPGHGEEARGHGLRQPVKRAEDRGAGGHEGGHRLTGATKIIGNRGTEPSHNFHSLSTFEATSEIPEATRAPMEGHGRARFSQKAFDVIDPVPHLPTWGLIVIPRGPPAQKFVTVPVRQG